jgi:uncharacterized protein (TIGR02996 family)
VNPDQSAFLQAIREQPDDDTVRLVYADWLDEHDVPSLAAYIRESIMLAYVPSKTEMGFKEWKDRVSKLTPPPFDTFDCVSYHAGSQPNLHERKSPRVVIDRGFICDVVCNLDWWLSHGPELVRWHPVQRVEVTDHIILPSIREGWCMIYESATGRDVFKHLWSNGHIFNENTSSQRLHFRSQQTAENSLSSALIEWALERLESDQPNFLATSAAVSASSGA